MPEIFFQGPSGRLEGKYYSAHNPNAPLALLLHPHPQHGGTMNNKVVYTMYKTFASAGFSVLRFNFRGVGRSEGVYDNGEGELSDAAAAMDWMHATFPGSSSFWLAGFSFGAWITLQLLMRRPEVNGFIAVSPPADRYDFSFLSPCPVSGQVIQGDHDDIVTHASVVRMMERVTTKPNITLNFQTIEGADHFFQRQQNELASIIRNYLNQQHHHYQKPKPKISTRAKSSVLHTHEENKESLLLRPFQRVMASR